MKTTFNFFAAKLFIAVLLLALNCRAADYTVHMTAGWTFSPSSLTVEASDTVTWINDDDSFFHNATSSTGLWATGSLDFEESKTLSFDTPALIRIATRSFCPSA